MQGNPLLLGDDGYNISRSVRLRSSATATFSRTTGTATSATTWTWSAWVKRGSLGSVQSMFSGGSSGSVSAATTSMIYFDNTDVIGVYFSGGSSQLNTTAVFRDPSAWYHIVVKVAATTATIYVNGVQVATGSVTPTYINANSTIQYFGIQTYSGSTRYFDGYLTEVNFIDGQALTPSSFGQTNSVTGVWQPIKYTGTYGTNGFYLNFSDNSAATAAAIGKDYSGNGNNWTPNNISVTAGVTYDSMLDVPTMYADGGNGRGNYPVLNPLGGYGATIGSGNLNVTGSSSGDPHLSTIAIPATGKWYAEFSSTAYNASHIVGWFGVCGITGANFSGLLSRDAVGNGGWYQNDTLLSSVQTGTINQVFGVAVDRGANTVQVYIDGVLQTAQTPTLATGVDLFFYYGTYTSGTGWANFGQRPFAYTPPTGFKALNTQNLPDATIKAGNKYFDASLYTGTGTTQTVTNSGAFQPDLVWLKVRSTTGSNYFFDAVRGAGAFITSDNTNAESANAQTLTAFNSNGFGLGTAGGAINGNGSTFVGWQWKKGAAQGFDIVTYTAPASGTFTVNHSLGVAPAMVISKTRGATGNWGVWHKSLASGTDSYLNLNLTQAVQTQAGIWGAGHTSTVTGGLVGWSDSANTTAVRYLFAEVAGFSKFGSYTGNGSADGPFVYCGFRPRFILVKGSSNVSSWQMFDTSRNTYNAIDNTLWADLSSAEGTAYARLDSLSNGFKVRAPSGADPNVSSATYIYAAFAENPFKNSLAR